MQTLILREPAAKKWSMSMKVEQKKEAKNSFLVGEVARHQERPGPGQSTTGPTNQESLKRRRVERGR